MTSDGKVRLYTYWKGMNWFICGGKIIIGPMKDVGIQLMSILIFIVGIVFYFGFIFNQVWNEISPTLSICTGVIIAASFMLYFITMCVDPGYVPPRSFFDNKYVKKTDADLLFIIEGRIKNEKPDNDINKVCRC